MLIRNILVKKSDVLPLFEERIVDDTGHSTEWMMELYSQGFTFDVISQGWFVNIAMKVYARDWEVTCRSVEMEKSTSPLKRSFGSSPGLINMIHASIVKRSKDMKKIPICICSCLFEQRTQNLNPLKQLVSENPRPHSLNYIDKGEYSYVSKSLRKGASSFFEISSYSLINKPKYLKEVLRWTSAFCLINSFKWWWYTCAYTLNNFLYTICKMHMKFSGYSPWLMVINLRKTYDTFANGLLLYTLWIQMKILDI